MGFKLFAEETDGRQDRGRRGVAKRAEGLAHDVVGHRQQQVQILRPDRTFVELDPFEHEVHWGHLDLLLGSRAPDIVWPRIEPRNFSVSSSRSGR